MPALPSPTSHRSLFERIGALARRARACFMALVEAQPLIVGISGTVTAFLVCAMSAAFLWHEREETLQHARQNSGNLVAVVASDLGHQLAIYDLLLRDVVAGVEEGDSPTLPPDVRARLGLGRLMTGEYFADAHVLDANGVVIASLFHASSAGMPLGDREYFRAHQHDLAPRTYISHPVASRLQHGEPTIVLSRRINALDGAFGGVAVIAVRQRYFNDLLATVDMQGAGRIGIAYRDGALLATNPVHGATLDAHVAANAAVRFADTSSATFEARDDEGIERAYTFLKVPASPFVVIAAPAIDDLLMHWRIRALAFGTLTLCIGTLLAAASWGLTAMIRVRLRLQAELEGLSLTDPLTQLNNRRALERKLNDAWALGRRKREPVSVLFIDIDRFRLFNEHYGHAFGDTVLAQVAATLARCCRRPSDFAARYGGEEFTLVLPGTDSRGALQVAQALRAAVQQLDIAHPGSEHGTVTVSVGSATCTPGAEDRPEDLLAAADTALYQAKAEGRNRVCVHAAEVEAALVAH